MSSQLSERNALVGTIDPATVSVGTADTDWIDLSHFGRAMFIVMTGTLGASGTVDFKLQESETSGGTATDITGKAITQLTKAAGDDNKQVIVEVSAAELSDDKRYVRGRLTIATANSPAAVVVLAGDARFAPPTDRDLDSVKEIVT